MVAVLTKADTLRLPAAQQLMEEEGLTMREAIPRAGDFAAQMLSKLSVEIEKQLNGSKYPPKTYLSMASESSKSLVYAHFDVIISMQV